MTTLVGVLEEAVTQIMYNDSSGANGVTGAGGNGDGAIRTTDEWYSYIVTIPAGEMPADIMFDLKNTLDQEVVCTLQGCNSSDFSTTPVHDCPNAITLAAGNVTAQTDYGYGPPRFKYYRWKCVASGIPTTGGLDIWATRFKS